jgi:hypothetical protein
MDTTKAPRRQIRYQTLQELLNDADTQAARQGGVTGNWSMGQIFEHLARTMEKSIDGFASRAPFFFRVLGKFVCT